MGATEHNRIPQKKKSIGQTIKDYLLITVSCIIYSVAVSLFLDPNSLAPGGVTGIAIILNRLIPVETGTLILLININCDYSIILVIAPSMLIKFYMKRLSGIGRRQNRDMQKHKVR